jgi:D-xylose ABC transporter substrate-binding protein
MILRYIKIILILIPLALVLQDCQKGKVKVGFLLDDFSSERWYQDRDLFIEHISELGGKIMVDSAMGDIKTQFEQAKVMLDKGVDVLVVVPANSEAAAAIVKLAHRYDVPVISYDRLIKNCDLDYYVSFDNTRVGELMSDYLSKRSPTGNYAIICGPASDNNSRLLKLGQMQVIQPYIEKGDIKVVYDDCVDEWSTEEGYRHMKKCLDSGLKVDAVLCGNDALAEGAIQALKERGMAGQVLVSGQDAETVAIQNIMAGYQTMTVYKPIEAIAITAANVATKLGRDEPITEAIHTTNNGQKMVPSILLDAMVVNRDNIDMTVVADGYLKKHNLTE